MRLGFQMDYLKRPEKPKRKPRIYHTAAPVATHTKDDAENDSSTSDHMLNNTPAPPVGLVKHNALSILIEAYNPRILLTKIVPVFKIRFLKIIGMVVNRFTGQYLLGWNGQENRMYDVLGKVVDSLFLRLYHHQLIQHDVFSFLHRRLNYAFITGTVTAAQIILTWQGTVFWAFMLSVVISPVTLIDRQWSTSVTKNPPRYGMLVRLHKTTSVIQCVKSFNSNGMCLQKFCPLGKPRLVDN